MRGKSKLKILRTETGGRHWLWAGRNPLERVIAKTATARAGRDGPLFAADHRILVDPTPIGAVGAAALDFLSEQHMGFPFRVFGR